MEYFAGLDVAMEETAICVIDREGKVVLLEIKVTTDPDAIFKALKPYAAKLRRVGHEAGSLSPWLQVELKQRGLPAVCVEAWHARAALLAMRNKTDKADARGIAHIMRTGWFREVHVKSDASYRLRLLLTQRRNLKRKFLDIENAIRHSIKTFGLRLGRVGRGEFETRVRELVADDRLIASLTDCMLRAPKALWQEYIRLHKVVLEIVRQDELRRRFMRIPGVGPISALAYKTLIDDPRRFRHSKTVGAYLGLTSRRWQSGTSIDIQGHISRAGDGGCAASALRGRQRHADALSRLLQPQGMGAEDCQDAWSQARLCGSGAQARGDHACDVARRQRVPVQGAEGAGQWQHDRYAKAYRGDGVTYK
jgi:transposase